ncbi:homoserine dehydrogenase [Phragmitibacter flavus]|uniref:Homoserine dehydrogenase n=1 Tax=Phragmitibacter flavus TaxID=2576071 RepID=A0A5R8KED1_9BACT|nr:homoserine dehydrogenase [Phragmitibacter flavus]TLD70597.1 homoserine dehydrogenase [Phragmitibacter flavus]
MPTPATQTHRIVRIGLAGLGNVGAGVYKNLAKNAGLLRERTGCLLHVSKVAVRDLSRSRDCEVPEPILTTDWRDLVNDPKIDVIVELIGGTETAFELVSAALHAKKPVVTGNKALLAERGQELFALAEVNRTPIYFEAAVAGGIPIIQTVQEGFVGNHIRSIHGIINGTCNYILTRMRDAGISYQEALDEAQKLGYAEADPTLDVSGWDAAHKAIILASLSYGYWVKPEDVLVEGIQNIHLADMAFADKLGYGIKLLSVIRADAEGRVEVRTQPSLLPKSHILASVGGAYNAVLVNGDIVGETLFYGKGAGQDPTSSSVISDLAEAAATLVFGARHSGFVPHGLYGKGKPIDETVSHYYVRLSVDDKPGVLGKVATLFGDRGIGISSVVQPEDLSADHTHLVLMLDDAPLKVMREAIAAISAFDSVREAPVWLRVETME